MVPYCEHSSGLTAWIAGAVISLFAFSTAAWAVPQFNNFPATPQIGPNVPLNWTKDILSFRTRIARAARQKANFAGHYVLAYWGCGASCVTGAVINKLNGQIIPLPFSVCCATPKSASFKSIEFRLTSRLIVFAGLRNEEKPMGAHFYEFNGTGFNFLTTVPDDGSFSSGSSPNQKSTSSNSISAAPDKKTGNTHPTPLKQGMPYVGARKLLIDAGWQAPILPSGGYDEKSKKVVEECSGDVAMCNAFPEIRNCSGQGYCLMEFTNELGEKLEITTYGDLSGSDPDATVTAWQQQPSR